MTIVTHDNCDQIITYPYCENWMCGNKTYSVWYTIHLSLSCCSCLVCRMKPPKVDKDEGDPSQGLMKLMKQMYDEGDDEMKRTIAKAWHESQEKREKEGKM